VVVEDVVAVRPRGPGRDLRRRRGVDLDRFVEAAEGGARPLLFGEAENLRFHRPTHAVALPTCARRIGERKHATLSKAALPARDEPIGDADGGTISV
jgi:hypothetical protein